MIRSPPVPSAPPAAFAVLAAMGATAASKSLDSPSPCFGSETGAPTLGPAAVYRRREPTATALYPIVQHHLESFLARAGDADSRGEGVPFWPR